MDKTRQDLTQTLIQMMMHVVRQVRHNPPPDAVILSPPQANLLFAIAHKKDGISVKELAESAGVTPGAITQFVDGLVEKGLVQREADPYDRRVVRLKLTELAKSQFEKFRKAHLESFSRMFEVFTNDEIKQLIALISKIDNTHETKEFNNLTKG
jgi:DNA-binding MarR family transcriptional regulator